MIKSVATENAEPSAARTAGPGLSGIDLTVWLCLLAGLLLLRALPAFTPALRPDSFQYLSAATNMLQGSFGDTSLVHYDVERSFGVVPAPMVTFPLGYPILIVLISLLGASLQSAGQGRSDADADRRERDVWTPDQSAGRAREAPVLANQGR